VHVPSRYLCDGLNGLPGCIKISAANTSRNAILRRPHSVLEPNGGGPICQGCMIFQRSKHPIATPYSGSLAPYPMEGGQFGVPCAPTEAHGKIEQSKHHLQSHSLTTRLDRCQFEMVRWHQRDTFYCENLAPFSLYRIIFEQSGHHSAKPYPAPHCEQGGRFQLILIKIPPPAPCGRCPEALLRYEAPTNPLRLVTRGSAMLRSPHQPLAVGDQGRCPHQPLAVGDQRQAGMRLAIPYSCGVVTFLTLTAREHLPTGPHPPVGTLRAYFAKFPY